MQPRKLLLALTLLLPVAFTSCGASNPVSTTTPAPVNSPQTQLHNVNKALADGISAAVNTAITLRNQGKISPVTARQIEDWSVSGSIISDKVEMEITSADTWPVQKQKILVILTGFHVPTIGTGAIDGTLQAALSAIGTLLQQLQGQVNQ